MNLKKPQPSAEALCAQGARRPAVEPPQSLPLSRRRAITGGVLLAMFLAALDATVVSTAMPTVIAQLGGLAMYSWVFSGYMLTSTVTVPIWGRLSDLFGRKRFYLLGIGLFVLGSMLAGQSRSMEMLILTRALQGLGAGALIPLGMTIVGDLYSLEERARMQGLFSGIWGFASIVGPLIGGFFTDVLSWRWAFYVNLPFGLAAAAVVLWAMPAPPRNRGSSSVDWLGVFALSAAVSLLLLGLLREGQLGTWTDPGVLALFAASAVGLAGFVGWERRVREPIFPLELFENKIFTAAALSGLFVGMAMFGSISFLPLFVQSVIGTSATEAGSTLTPFMLGWVVFSTLGGRWVLRVGYRVTVFSGMGLLVSGFVLFTTFTAATSRAYVLGAVGLAGAGMGLIVFTLLLAVQNAVPRRQLGIATSASVFTRMVGGTIGVAVLGTVLSLGLTRRLGALGVQELGPEGRSQLVALVAHPEALITGAGAGLDPRVLRLFRETLAGALHEVFLVGLGFALIALVATFLIPKGKVQEHAHRDLAT